MKTGADKIRKLHSQVILKVISTSEADVISQTVRNSSINNNFTKMQILFNKRNEALKKI